MTMNEKMSDRFPRRILTEDNPNDNTEKTADQFPSVKDIVDAFYKKKDGKEDQAGKSDFDNAVEKEPQAKKWSREAISNIVERSLKEMSVLEHAAQDKERWRHLSPEMARSVKRIVVFSAPGTYTQPVKDDRWKHLKWAWGMDRLRDDRATRLGVVLSGLVTGKDFSVFNSLKPLDANDPDLKDLRENAKEAVVDAKIRFVYIGRPDEVAEVHNALRQNNSFIPENIVDSIDDPKIDNTVDQVRELGKYLHEKHAAGDIKEGDSIIFVAHGPQLVRMAGLFNQYNSIPSGVNVLFDPLPIPHLGITEYPFMETKGTTFNRVSGISAESCPYKILGA